MRTQTQTSARIVAAVACSRCRAERGAPCVRPQTNVPIRAARLQPLLTVHDERRAAAGYWTEATS